MIETCDNCRGTGTVPRYVDDDAELANRAIPGMHVDCEICKGAGWLKPQGDLPTWPLAALHRDRGDTECSVRRLEKRVDTLTRRLEWQEEDADPQHEAALSITRSELARATLGLRDEILHIEELQREIDSRAS